jgi:hypothetical protein
MIAWLFERNSSSDGSIEDLPVAAGPVQAQTSRHVPDPFSPLLQYSPAWLMGWFAAAAHGQTVNVQSGVPLPTPVKC